MTDELIFVISYEMPRIFDNTKQHLFTALQETLQVSNLADFCVMNIIEIEYKIEYKNE